ncbi:zinc carboxypeptidase domain-containing protein [Phthorimaea operculella]|nr:zinc carboxypeptidase domain-containing protein [Phthorimaea operculella]
MKSKIFVLFLYATVALAAKRTYEGYEVYKVKPNTKDQVAVLNSIGNNGIGEFWKEYVSAGTEVDVMVSKENKAEFLARLNGAQISATVLMPDLKKQIEEQQKSPAPTSRNTESFHSMTWEKYHSLEEIYEWLDELASSYPNQVETVVWGQTYEGRDIKGIIIDYDKENLSKPVGVIESTLHAREWITPATVTWIIKEFLTSSDPEIRTLAENFEWHILPVANPDGYSYTFTSDRMWRKNRNPAYNKTCAAGVDDDMSNGVDLNRNFDYQWMQVGASSDSCTNTFAGPSANSELETRAIINYVNSLRDRNIVYYLAFHSYTQLIIMPYSHFTTVEQMVQEGNTNYADMYEIGVRAAEALTSRFGTPYRVGISADVMYPMSGTSFDWVKQELDVPVCYLIELRDLGEFGFLLPASQIIPNNLEVMDFIKEMDRYTRALGIYKYQNFKGYKVYKVVPKTEKDVKVLKDIETERAYQFWTEVIRKGQDVRIMVAPENQLDLEARLKAIDGEVKVAITDVQNLLDAQLRVIIDYQKREQKIVGILEGGLHSREWISPATMTYVINEFLTSDDPEVRALAENVVWHIFPVVNPDGYVYTFTNNRMWRKNRSPASYTTCGQGGQDNDLSNGVDLNRNFGFRWMTVGASSNPCDETYAGPSANSELETISIINYVRGLQANENNHLLYYFAFHSFTQLMLVPFSDAVGANVLQVPNYADLFEIAVRGADAIQKRYNTEYTVGTSGDILYNVSGSSFDWAKGDAEVPIVFLFELRDNGDYGFFLPPDQIIENNEEIIDALVEMDRVTRQMGYYHQQQVQILKDLRKNGYEYWDDDYFTVGSDVRIMVSPGKNEEFVQYTRSVGLNSTLKISNVQELIDAQMQPAQSTERSTHGSYSWTVYHPLERIHAWLDELEDMYPGVVQTVTIGTSFEGRPMKGVIIDFKAGERGPNPLIGMIEGGMHSREWISPATVTWVIKEFLTSEDPDVRFMAETFVWHIFPVMNPDGYVYSFTNDRMWRKNRNPAHFTNCSSVGEPDDKSNGIDLNRNFDFVWLSVGASQNPCEETYAGPSAASEREAQALQAYVMQLKQQGNFIYYLAFHSYMQMVLIPYSHVTGNDVLEADNYGDLYEIAARSVDKLTSLYGTQYRFGTSAEILYAVSGSSFDWVKGVAEVPIVYLIELRDTGTFGFMLPTDQIIPNCEEVMAFLVEMDKTTRILGYYSSGASGVFAGVLSMVVAVVLVAGQY